MGIQIHTTRLKKKQMQRRTMHTKEVKKLRQNLARKSEEIANEREDLKSIRSGINKINCFKEKDVIHWTKTFRKIQKDVE